MSDDHNRADAGVARKLIEGLKIHVKSLEIDVAKGASWGRREEGVEYVKALILQAESRLAGDDKPDGEWGVGEPFEEEGVQRVVCPIYIKYPKNDDPGSPICLCLREKDAQQIVREHNRTDEKPFPREQVEALMEEGKKIIDGGWLLHRNRSDGLRKAITALRESQG